MQWSSSVSLKMINEICLLVILKLRKITSIGGLAVRFVTGCSYLYYMSFSVSVTKFRNKF
jgi:hypothetical protein